MYIESILVSGKPMLPTTYRTILYYDEPLIGTFEIDGSTVLFWAADAHDDPVMRYAYVELTAEEAEKVQSYFLRDTFSGYEEHPLLSNRRVVVALSNGEWSIDKVTVIN